METVTMTLSEFLLARIAEDEAAARMAQREGVYPHFGDTAADETLEMALSEGCAPEGAAHFRRHDPARVLAECEAKRRIVELHKSWPVLVEQPPTFEPVDTSDPSTFTMRASQQMAWLTEQEYRERFGDEPPTAPMLRALAAVFADHPDYREEWKP